MIAGAVRHRPGDRPAARLGDAIDAPPSPGEFMWAGYRGTYFRVDPQEDLVAVLMSLQVGERAHYRRLFKTLVYQAVVA